MKARIANIATAFSSLLTVLLLVPKSALAAGKCEKEVAGFLNFPTWYKYIIESEGPPCQLKPELMANVPGVLLAIFEIILRVGGILAVVMVLYGGFQFILSQAEPDKVKGARGTIINAIIGLIITMSAVAIVNLIGKNL